MKKIIFATGNADKMKEIRKILADLDAEVVSMKEAGIQADIVEDGKTFEENAVIKATAISKLTSDGEIVLADDSGLEIDYLNKEPGVYSARYMGHDTSYDIKNQAIIDRLAGVEDKDRTARFVCAMAAVFPDGRHFTTRGTMEGIIVYNRFHQLGVIEKNTDAGIYGELNSDRSWIGEEVPIQVAEKEEIKTGEARIRCYIDGEVKEYSIRVTQIDKESDQVNKGMVIQVTDTELLEKTGGIIQGMSGSPIIQNGKLIGAVTHVFVQDSTKGYGIFIENMLKEEES